MSSNLTMDHQSIQSKKRILNKPRKTNRNDVMKKQSNETEKSMRRETANGQRTIIKKKNVRFEQKHQTSGDGEFTI